MVWADGETRMGGSISAQSGINGGDGGFVETSGHALSVTGGKVSTLAPAGKTGTWLLDPTAWIIANSGGDETPAALQGRLAGSNIVITTGSGGSGDITVNDAVNWTSTNTLTLSAYHDVLVNADITNAGSGAITLRADNSGSSSGTVIFGGAFHVGTQGAISILYNPGGGYASPTNYNANISAGTLTASMLVNDVTQLQAVSNNLAGTYALGRSIDANATSGWNSNGSGGYYGFAPIGDTTTNFTGSLDGLGHTISNLYINRPTEDYVGLFGAAGSGSSLSNLVLGGGSVTGERSITGGVQARCGTVRFRIRSDREATVPGLMPRRSPR
ncbi:hypothetical protein WCLP8_3400001 [uncultured Gammaproteobacteria bacterium]